MKELTELGGKSAGQLIKPEDWNDLVGHVIRLEADLGVRIDDLGATVTDQGRQLADLNDALGRLGADLGDLRGSFEALVAGRWRLTLNTTRTSFLTGQRARLEARLADLAGQPLRLSELAERPWVDFVTVWGRFRAVPGTVSRGGEGDRSISVQVDAQGVARVDLAAEQPDGVEPRVADEVATAFETRLRLPVVDAATPPPTAAEFILGSNNPREAAEVGAFRIFSAEYLRTDSNDFQNYVDAQVIQQPARLPGVSVFEQPTLRWPDRRTAVLAFVKTDPDAATADLSHGGASIVVTFREWIRPWLALDFLAELDDEVAEATLTFQGLLAQSEASESFFQRFNEEVASRAESAGFVGGQRYLRVADEALTRVQPPPDAGFREAAGAARDAVNMQLALSTGSFLIGGGQADIGRRVVTNLTLQTSRGSRDVGSAVRRSEELALVVRQAEQRLDDLARSFTGVDQRLQQVNQEASGIGAQFNVVQAQLANLEGLNAGEVVESLGEIRAQVRALQGRR